MMIPAKQKWRVRLKLKCMYTCPCATERADYSRQAARQTIQQSRTNRQMARHKSRQLLDMSAVARNVFQDAIIWCDSCCGELALSERRTRTVSWSNDSKENALFWSAGGQGPEFATAQSNVCTLRRQKDTIQCNLGFSKEKKNCVCKQLLQFLPSRS